MSNAAFSGIMSNVTGQAPSLLPEKNAAEAERYLDQVMTELANARSGLKSIEEGIQLSRKNIETATNNLMILQSQQGTAINYVAELQRRRRQAIQQLDEATAYQEKSDLERGVKSAWTPPVSIAPQPGGAMEAARQAASPAQGSPTSKAIDAATPAAARAWAEEQQQTAANLELTRAQIAKHLAATKPNDAAPEAATNETAKEESK